MTNDDFKKLLDEALEPIKERQESQSTDLANIIAKLESHSAALITIESKLNAYGDGDMYKINDANIRKAGMRVTTLEKKAGVKIPPELELEPLPEAA